MHGTNSIVGGFVCTASPERADETDFRMSRKLMCHVFYGVSDLFGEEMQALGLSGDSMHGAPVVTLAYFCECLMRMRCVYSS